MSVTVFLWLLSSITSNPLQYTVKILLSQIWQSILCHQKLHYMIFKNHYFLFWYHLVITVFMICLNHNHFFKSHFNQPNNGSIWQWINSWRDNTRLSSIPPIWLSHSNRLYLKHLLLMFFNLNCFDTFLFFKLFNCRLCKF
jgi:hypothetical protein